jgi:HpcH/HpaI aldolase/citrate lyase family
LAVALAPLGTLTVADTPMRSKLFVPGSRPELFAKALAGDADGISFDLEDTVQEDRKAEAQVMLGERNRALLGELGVDERAYGRLLEAGVACEGGVPNAAEEDQEVPG